jgi:hypothetical protein
VTDVIEGPGAPPGRNAGVIAELIRRCRRRGRWLGSFSVLIPLGCAVFSLFFVAGVLSETGPIYALAGIALFVAGVVGVLLATGSFLSCKRSLAVALQADVLGFLYVEGPKASDYPDLSGLPFFSRAETTTARNLLVGRTDGEAVLSLDCDLVFPGSPASDLGIGPGPSAFHQTVVYLPDAGADLPEFALYPRAMFEKFSRHLEDLPIELREGADFVSEHAVRGKDPERVRACLTFEVQELCLAGKGLTLVARGGVLAVFRQNRRIASRDLPERLEEAVRLAAALRKGAASRPGPSSDPPA